MAKINLNLAKDLVSEHETEVLFTCEEFKKLQCEARDQYDGSFSVIGYEFDSWYNQDTHEFYSEKILPLIRKMGGWYVPSKQALSILFANELDVPKEKIEAYEEIIAAGGRFSSLLVEAYHKKKTDKFIELWRLHGNDFQALVTTFALPKKDHGSRGYLLMKKLERTPFASEIPMIYWYDIIGITDYYSSYIDLPWNENETPPSEKMVKHLVSLGPIHSSADIKAIVTLVRVFGKDINGLKKYGVVDYQSRHDLGLFDHRDLLSGWDKLLAAKPTLRFAMSNAIEIQKILGRVPASVSECQAVIDDIRFKSLVEIEDDGTRRIVADAIERYGFSLSAAAASHYQKLYESPSKSSEFVPNFYGECDGVRMRRLDARDPLGPMIGQIVKCCQHLHSNAVDCAINTWTSPYSAVFVFEQISTGNIVAEIYAVRMPGDTVLFDSVEGRKSADTVAISELIKMAGKAMLGKLGVNRVVVGDTEYGMTKEVLRELSLPRLSTWNSRPFEHQYLDASGAYLLAEDGHLRYVADESSFVEPFIDPKRIRKTDFNFDEIDAADEGDDDDWEDEEETDEE